MCECSRLCRAIMTARHQEEAIERGKEKESQSNSDVKVDRMTLIANLEKGATYEALFLLLQISGMLSAANTEPKDYDFKTELGAQGFLLNALGESFPPGRENSM